MDAGDSLFPLASHHGLLIILSLGMIFANFSVAAGLLFRSKNLELFSLLCEQDL